MAVALTGAATWALLCWFVLVFGGLIYELLGDGAERSLLSPRLVAGIGLWVDNARQWQDVAKEALQVRWFLSGVFPVALAVRRLLVVGAQHARPPSSHLCAAGCRHVRRVRVLNKTHSPPQAAVVLVVLDRLHLLGGEPWLEAHLDSLSVQSTLSSTGGRCRGGNR